MTTLYDPEKIRRLAESGDPFWKGAAWILDQQDAAWQMQRQIKALSEAMDQITTRYAFPQRHTVVPLRDTEEYRRLTKIQAPTRGARNSTQEESA